MFVETQYHVGPDGSFGAPVDGSAGLWLSIKDDYVVEWTEGEASNE